MDSLEAIFTYHNEPWNLSIQQHEIVPASYVNSLWHYVESFFTNQHTDSLRKHAATLLNRITGFTEQQKIYLEKISALIHRKNQSWLHGIETKLPAPHELAVAYQRVDRPGLMQPLQEGGRFVNFLGERIWRQFLQTLYLLFPGTFSNPTEQEDIQSLLAVKWDPIVRSNAPEISWLGHATVLLQVAGFNLLLDPSFHFCPPCFRRHIAPGIRLEELPLIDAVAISHNHADHCEPKAIRFLSGMQPFMFVPKNFDEWTKKQGCIHVKDNVWWEQTVLEREGKKMTLTSVPAQHGSQQSLSDLNMSLWQGVVIEVEGKTFYFSGDTALREGLFEQIHSVFPNIDVAFLPIAPEEEEAVHVNCQEALIAFERVGAKTMIPIHWAAYRQSKYTLEDPLLRLHMLLEGDYQHLQHSVYLPKVGERMSLEKLQEIKQRKVG